MLKKRLIISGIIVAVICAILIPPVRAAAESALSVFRVTGTKTITLSVGDLRDMMTYVKNNSDAAQAEQGPQALGILTDLLEQMKSEVKPLESAGDFTAFPFALPTALRSETPQLYATESQVHAFTLNTEKINSALSKLGATSLLDGSLNGTEITINTPPVIVAEYADVTLAATQNAYIDAPDAVKTTLWSSLLSIPAIPENLRAQLAAIDPGTRDIYLPVIEGLGRETDLGSTLGYVYTADDLANVLGAIPGFDGDAQLAQLREQDASVLLWTRNGVLYCLAGAMSDSALSQIARSIR